MNRNRQGLPIFLFFCFFLLTDLPANGKSVYHASPESGSAVLTAAGPEIQPRQDLGNGWQKTVIPVQDLELWVADSFLVPDGTFRTDTVYRMAPTALSERVSLDHSAGRKAVILEETKEGFWNKVRVSGSVSVYCRKEKTSPVSKPAERAQRPVVRIPPIYISNDGVLLPLKKPVGKATHKLVFSMNRHEYLVAYIIPEKMNLELWEKRNIHLNGRIFWERGFSVPFMIPSQIMPSWK